MRGRPSWRQRGSSMVEVTMVVALLLLVIFGVVEAGRVMVAYTTLSDAARAGTRYAMVHGANRRGASCTTLATDGPSGPAANPACVLAAAEAITNAAGLGSATVSVSYPDSSNAVGHPVTVTVSYVFTTVVPALIPLPAITLQSTSQGTISY